MLLLLLLAITSGHPLPNCDLVEINHYYPNGQHAFTQIIAWDWDAQYRRWHAHQWAIVQDWERTQNVTTIQTIDQTIKLESKLFRETTTTNDPERDNRILFPTKYRRAVW